MSELMPLPQGWADAPLAQLRALSAASRFADAEALGRQLLARDPRQGQVWFELARLALLGGRPDLAIERLQRTVDCSPDGQTLGEVGQMWLMLRRPHDAEPALRRAIELEPDVASHHNNLGAALKRSGQLEAAGNQALGDTGRPQQEDALTAEGGQQTESQRILPFIEPLAKGCQQSRQPLLDGNDTRRVLCLS